jgi:signal transduction histidine kinase
MAFHRLTWRVGFPFVLLVLAETLGLAALLAARTAADERARLELVARANADFIENTSLPTSDQLAGYLSHLSGYEVFFRHHEALHPIPAGELAALPLAALPADGRAHEQDAFEFVAVPIAGKHDLLLARQRPNPWLDARLLSVLGAFLLLAMLTAWLVVRGLVRPLQHLARQLPEIEKTGPLTMPEAARSDEIGDLARAFVRTRRALHEEQDARERMEKLAVLGRMTAALAHEVQNPVAAIRMHAQLWRSHTGDDAATTIEQEAARIESLLNQWMFLTRPEPPVRARIDVGALLHGVVASNRGRSQHAAVQVEVDVEQDLFAEADGRRLGQVFHNLLTNALQAMPGGGRLRVRGLREGERVRVSFTDSGTGFSRAALERCAEFFFSEKEGGMGIGLSVASEIVKAHGGALTVGNAPAGGAIVVVELPAATAPEEAACPLSP